MSFKIKLLSILVGGVIAGSAQLALAQRVLSPRLATRRIEAKLGAGWKVDALYRAKRGGFAFDVTKRIGATRGIHKTGSIGPSGQRIRIDSTQYTH